MAAAGGAIAVALLARRRHTAATLSHTLRSLVALQAGATSAVDAEAARMIKVYVIPDKEDAACVRLANGEYQSLQPNPERDDDEADAYEEHFTEELPEAFSPERFRLLTEDDLLQDYSEIEFGFRSEDIGALPAMGPPIQTPSEAAALMREEADALDVMHTQGWNYDGVVEGWCSATTALVTEPGGKVKVYVLPEDECAAAVRLATGQYHVLRPRTAEDEGLMVDTAAQELDQIWSKVQDDYLDGNRDVPRPNSENEPSPEDFKYVEGVEDALPPPFTEQHTRLMRLEHLQADYDATFGTDTFNYGEAIDFEGCKDLRDVATRLREKATELEGLEKRGWRVDSVDGQFLVLRTGIAHA